MLDLFGCFWVIDVGSDRKVAWGVTKDEFRYVWWESLVRGLGYGFRSAFNGSLMGVLVVYTNRSLPEFVWEMTF